MNQQFDQQSSNDVGRPRTRRGCGIILLLTLLTVSFLCGAIAVLYAVFPPPPLDIIVMGLDARGAEGNVSRTDSLMLVNVYPGRVRISLLSIPRDLFFEVPGYGRQRVNTINVLGEMDDPGSGPDLLKKSIQATLDVDVDRYVRLDFNGFVEIVDAVGGVDVYVQQTIVDSQYPTQDGGVQTIRFESGWQTLNGDRALIYARTRQADDDYRRAERQQQIVTALGAKLANPLHWGSVLSILSRNVETDITLPDLLASIPPVVLSGGRYEQRVIDRDAIQGTADGYAIPDIDQLRPWLQEHFD